MKKRDIWFLILALATAFAQSIGAQSLESEMVRVAEGVYVFMPREPGIGNSVAVINSKDVFVVDATATPSGAQAILNEIEKLTDKHVRYVVNTHWHDDHFWGNQAYIATFPNVEFIAHANTRRDFLNLAVPGLAQNIAKIREKIEQRDAVLRSSLESDGQPLTPARRDHLEKRQELFGQVLAQFESVEPVPPTLTLVDSLIFYREDKEIRILYLGKGHTSGDLVVHLPGQNILITGDLLTYPIPSRSFVIDWITTLTKLDALEPQVIVPGHGPVMYDRAYLSLVRGLLESLVAQVKHAVASGMSLEETRKTIDVEGFREKLRENDPVPPRAFEAFFLTMAVEKTYKELTETMDRKGL